MLTGCAPKRPATAAATFLGDDRPGQLLAATGPQFIDELAKHLDDADEADLLVAVIPLVESKTDLSGVMLVLHAQRSWPG